MSTRLTDNIRRRSISWAGQLTKLAKANAPAHLRPYIHSRVEDKDGKLVLRVYINRRENQAQKYGSMDARAQEYGSGIRARRGSKQKYIIRPKNKKILAFHWEVADANPENFTFAPDGRVLLHSVNHPGIKAANDGKGYIAPAMNELRRRARKELDKDVRQAILGDLRVSFTTGRK